MWRPQNFGAKGGKSELQNEFLHNSCGVVAGGEWWEYCLSIA
jgi:hypothetical protein